MSVTCTRSIVESGVKHHKPINLLVVEPGWYT